MSPSAHDGSAPGLFDALFGSASIDACLDDSALLQAMLDFEAALARSEAGCGVIPIEAAESIAGACDVRHIDRDQIREQARAAGNLAIPLVRALTECVSERDPAAAGYVHWGATSQDAIDTGTMLQLRRVLVILEAELERAIGAAAQLARQHADATMAGRTWLQQAVPITFGLKAAGWLDALMRQQLRLARLHDELALQFGGAAGTLASLGERGAAVAAALARELDISQPLLAWHGQRDRVVAWATTLASLVGTLGKIAGDIILLAQTEVGEASEMHRTGRGGSSTMPHKRNPVACVAVRAAAQRVPGLAATMLAAMPQEHERGAGGWHAEWQTLPEICRLCGGALTHIADVLTHLEIDRERMGANLLLLRGLNLAESVSMALAAFVGRAEAHAMVEAACDRALASGRTLALELGSDARVTGHLTASEIEGLLEPSAYLGSTRAMIVAVLADAAARESP